MHSRVFLALSVVCCCSALAPAADAQPARSSTSMPLAPISVDDAALVEKYRAEILAMGFSPTWLTAQVYAIPGLPMLRLDAMLARMLSQPDVQQLTRTTHGEAEGFLFKPPGKRSAGLLFTMDTGELFLTHAAGPGEVTVLQTDKEKEGAFDAIAPLINLDRPRSSTVAVPPAQLPQVRQAVPATEPPQINAACPNHEQHLRQAVEYPREALLNNQQGRVEYMFTITSTGAVTDLIILSSTNRIFNRPTLAAASGLVCDPRYAGMRVKSFVNFAIRP